VRGILVRPGGWTGDKFSMGESYKYRRFLLSEKRSEETEVFQAQSEVNSFNYK